jgi:AraC-like DNA-binding protein
MTNLPIPFVAAFLVVLLACSNYQQLKETSTGRMFAIFLYLNALSMVCIGFRWSHELLWLLPIAALLALISTALLYLIFLSLGRRGPVIHLSRDWLHLIPPIVLAILGLTTPQWVEFLLVATKLMYAGLLIQLARQAPSSLQFVRLNWFNNSQKALWGTAVLLVFSVGVDVAIFVDFALFDGRHAARLVGVANLVIVSLLGWASVLAGRGNGADAHASGMKLSDIENPEIDPSTGTQDTFEHDAQLQHTLNQLLIEHRLYADTDLNLQKLARKAGVPVRIVSRAINTHAQKNVSQWINSARVDAVCELLTDKKISVTQAMNDAGFLTKSNFYREFRRLKGCSPTQWREEH